MRKRYALATSDWHLTSRKPVFRKENWQECQAEKVLQVLDLCVDTGAVLYNAGDLFDVAKDPRRFVNKYLRIFRNHAAFHMVCAGQHDQQNQSSDLQDTNFGTLLAAGVIHRIGEENVYSADWGDEKMFTTDSDILLAHACVTPREVAFISYSITAAEFLKKTKARTIITGDYHVPHTRKDGDRLLVNPGTITRNKADMLDFKPRVYLIDLDTNEIVDEIFLKVLPADEVFDLEAIEKSKKILDHKEEMENLQNFITTMKEKGKVDPDFDGCLDFVVTTTKPREEVKVELAAIMEVANAAAGISQ